MASLTYPTKQDLPFRWGYGRASTAMRVEGTGKSWPPP